jgi:hypothetical protein
MSYAAISEKDAFCKSIILGMSVSVTLLIVILFEITLLQIPHIYIKFQFFLIITINALLIKSNAFFDKQSFFYGIRK